MVSKRYHTLVIMPSTPGKRIIKFSLPSLYWPVFFVMLAALLCWSGLGTWSLYQHKQITDQSLALLKENLLARGKIEDQRQKIAYLNNELEEIRKQSLYIRRFLGLEPSGMSEGKLGQGGKEIFSPADDIRPDVTPLSTSEQMSPSYTISPPSWLSTQEVTDLHTDLNRIIKTLHDRQKEMEHTPSISPVDPRKSWISSLFGIRISPFTGRKHFHLGVDIAGWKGTPIMAPAKGKVIRVGKWGALGLMVRIKHSSTYTTEYGHLQKAAVKKGQTVERGEIIGYMGNSGRSTGYHLHYGLKKSGKHVNPLPYMMDWDKNYFRFPEGDNKTAKK
jgi:murein DD-endopeptidase MepM/ murein hydrolase activator NlpD